MFSTTNIHCTMYFLPCFTGIRKIAPRSGLGFGLGLVLELGSGPIFLEGNFPRAVLLHLFFLINN